MSRSYRHTPIVKSGRDQSNREFKVEAHQKFRRETKKAIDNDLVAYEAADGLYGECPVLTYPKKLREVSEIWDSKQEYKWKEFGNFWAEQAREIAQDMIVRPYYNFARAVKDVAWAKRAYIRFFNK